MPDKKNLTQKQKYLQFLLPGLDDRMVDKMIDLSILWCSRPFACPGSLHDDIMPFHGKLCAQAGGHRYAVPDQIHWLWMKRQKRSLRKDILRQLSVCLHKIRTKILVKIVACTPPGILL